MTKTNKIPGPEVGYTDILNHTTNEAQLKQQQAEKEGTAKKRMPLRPSSSGACERELAYQLMEYLDKAYYEKPIMEPETVRLLSLGHTIESNFLWQFKQASEFFEIKYTQQTLGFFDIKSEDPRLAVHIEGNNDGCFVGVSEKWKCVFDIKSKKNKFSSYTKDSWTETDEKLKSMNSVVTLSETAYYADDLEAFLEELNDPFFEANFLQLNLYCNSDFMKSRGFDHGSIIQYEKNASRIREIRFKPSEKLYLKIKDKFQSAADAAHVGDPNIAARTYQLGSIKCAFCNFKDHCWGDEVNTQKEYFKTLPNKYWPIDINKIEDSNFKTLIEEYDSIYNAEKEKEQLELKVAKFMNDNKKYKIKLDNGNVYELKTYKNSMSVKRGKV